MQYKMRQKNAIFRLILYKIKALYTVDCCKTNSICGSIKLANITNTESSQCLEINALHLRVMNIIKLIKTGVNMSFNVIENSQIHIGYSSACKILSRDLECSQPCLLPHVIPGSLLSLYNRIANRLAVHPA